MNDRVRLRVLYEGRVQGVGFRYTVRQVAAGFEITGFVRNLADGRVELVAEGLKDEVEAFEQAIRDSGLGHFITRDQTARTPATGEYRGFGIVS